jgi:exonuclease VII small subunit
MSKQSITDQLSELEKIVQWFESQKEVDVEKGLGQVKAGAQLIKDLRARLKAVENEFVEIKKDLEEE